MTHRRVPAASRNPGSPQVAGAAAPPGTPSTRGRRHRGDRGSETVEIVLILPALMALFVAALQLAMWGLAAHALDLAVADGGAQARAQSGSNSSAALVVHQEISSVAGSLIGSVNVRVQQLPDDFVSVSATGNVPTIFPGIRLQVSATSAGPVQGFRPTG